jgi:hypothetical protein
VKYYVIDMFFFAMLKVDLCMRDVGRASKVLKVTG